MRSLWLYTHDMNKHAVAAFCHVAWNVSSEQRPFSPVKQCMCRWCLFSQYKYLTSSFIEYIPESYGWESDKALLPYQESHCLKHSLFLIDMYPNKHIDLFFCFLFFLIKAINILNTWIANVHMLVFYGLYIGLYILHIFITVLCGPCAYTLVKNQIPTKQGQTHWNSTGYLF